MPDLMSFLTLYACLKHSEAASIVLSITSLSWKIETKYASKGVQVVGISVDSADNVRQFALKYRIGYPLLIGSFAVLDLSRRLGNTASALPYTVVLNRRGKVIRTRLGGITEAELEKAIQLANG